MIAQYHKLALTAGFVLAIAFTFNACSSDSGGGGGDASSSSGDDGSSSSATGSSSSNGPTTDLCAGFVDGTTREHYGKEKKQFCDSRDGQKYVYVEIGTQTWMAENLNYEASGSKCFDNLPAKCVTYGKLYNWTTAMAGSASSDANPSGVKGICPAGWHLPSEEEWNVLMKSVNPSCTDNDDCGAGAGTKLKANSLWSLSYGIKGTDDFGFSALPGGIGYLDGSFESVEYIGYWWSASEWFSLASGWRMGYDNYDAYDSPNNKNYLRSVRCVQDYR